MRAKKGLIFVISGPSGSGKTTLLGNLIKDAQLKNRLARSISFTTRPKRSNEREGKDYFFFSEKEFKAKLKAKRILEWTKYLGCYYATPKDFVEQQQKKGKNIVLCLDLKGARKLKQLYPRDTVTIFLLPPSLKALRLRISERCRKTKAQELQQRLEIAKAETRCRHDYDFCLVNKDLKKTTQALKKIILKKLTERILAR